MEFLILWIVGAFVASLIAKNKGLSGSSYFVLSILLSPLIGIIWALVAKPNTAAIEKSQVAAGAMKKCPFCAELIKPEAVVCRYCGREVPKDSPAPSPAPVVPAPVTQATIPGDDAPAVSSIVTILLGVFVVLAVAIYLFQSSTAPSTPSSTPSKYPAIIPAMMDRAGEDQRSSILHTAITGAGEDCYEVTRTFLQGRAQDGSAFWNAQCSNGRRYSVELQNTDTIDARVLDCDVLLAVSQVECFKPLR